MKQQDKELLLKDLGSRLSYNVKCQVFNDEKPYILSGVLHNKPYSQLYFEELDWKEFDGFVGIEYCKPYLFPLSSMTEEQKTSHNFLKHSAYANPIKLIDWYNKNHFDYHGLIPLGLANDATDKNIY